MEPRRVGLAALVNDFQFEFSTFDMDLACSSDPLRPIDLRVLTAAAAAAASACLIWDTLTRLRSPRRRCAVPGSSSKGSDMDRSNSLRFERLLSMSELTMSMLAMAKEGVARSFKC